MKVLWRIGDVLTACRPFRPVRVWLWMILDYRFLADRWRWSLLHYRVRNLSLEARARIYAATIDSYRG
jgi:hypothetical protein